MKIENILFGVAILIMVGCLFMAALLLSGCTTEYPMQTTTMKLPMPVGYTLKAGEQAPILTIFSKQEGALAMVCGAVVQYTNGQPAQMINGNCDTILSMIAGSPVNIGMAAALIPLLK